VIITTSAAVLSPSTVVINYDAGSCQRHTADVHHGLLVMQLPASALSGLETVINRYLRLDPHAAARLAALQGRSIAVTLDGIDITLYMLPDTSGLQLRDSLDTEPDAVIHGTPLAMARLGLSANSERSLFSGDVVIEGDVATGQAFKTLLDELDIDWEEQLSHLTGDVIAHKLGNLARRSRRVLRQGIDTLQQDVSEYLQEELRVLPSRIEADNFSHDVTRTSMDVDRLAARVKRLQSQRHDNTNN